MDSVFDELYSNYHQDVFNFLIYMVHNRQLAEDLVQEVYIRVLKSHQNFEGKSSEKTWLFSIAKNVAIDHYRKQKNWKNRLLDKFDWNRDELSSKDAPPEEIVVANDEIKMLYDSLKLCTTDYRMVIIMRYLQELSIKETAEILDWTESKVKTTQHRALKWLKVEMNQRSGKEGEDIEEIRMERS
jgi:RNA polymerase sigma-70 factor, ECF subfamily